MGFAPELLKFFWPLNQPLDPGGRVTQKPLSVVDFIEQHSITGNGVFDVLRIINVLINEKLLVPFVNQGGPFGQTFYSLANPTDDQIAYGTFDCLALGFVFIRENFERSVIPLIFSTKEREAVGTGFLVAEDSILTARHCIDESLSMRIPGLSVSSLRSIKVPGENLNMDIALLTFNDELVPGARPLRFGQANLLDDVMVMGYPPIKGFHTVQVSETAQVAGFLHSSVGQLIGKANSYLEKQDYLLITARVKGGNSGGPVLNRRGEVVGMVVGQPAGENLEPDSIGFGAALSSEEITKFLEAKASDLDGVRFEIREDALIFSGALDAI